jgi:ferric iron reductase protein FhuF
VEIPGAELLEAGVLTAQVRDQAAYWRTDSLRTAAAIHWYGLGQVLLDPAVQGRVRGVRITADPRRLLLSGDGRFYAQAVPTGPAGDGDAAALHELCRQYAVVSGGSSGVFVAIAGDSLGTRVLAHLPGRPVDEITAVAAGLADELTLPRPRFRTAARGVVLHRQSCCQLYRVPRGGLCTSCPRRPAGERAQLLGC